MNTLIRIIRKIYNPRIEDFCTRLLYFFNTIDTYFVVAGAISFTVYAMLYGWQGSVIAFVAVTAAIGIIYKIADFYPLFLLLSPLYIVPLALYYPSAVTSFGCIVVLNVVIFIAIQFMFMGIPDSIVARDISIGFRKLWFSLLTIAPTTVSFSMSIAFSVLYAYTLMVVPDPRQSGGALFWGGLLIAALITRLFLPRSFVSADNRPVPKRAMAQRVIVINIDGCRFDRFTSARLPFLTSLQAQGAYFPNGIETVYRALTNPAFASILTGALPAVHGIRSNNLGQKIKVQGLPDIVKTKLYGSMHVQHFSKKHWDTGIVSLPTHSVYKSDDIMFTWLQRDLEAHDDTRLFIADISETDFLGHAYGSGSDHYLAALKRADARIADFYVWLEQRAFLKDTIIIICSDHGIVQIDHSYLLFQAERFVPCIFYGPGIRKNKALTYRASIMDIASTISFILGVPYPDHCRGRVFTEALENISNYGF